MRISSTSYVTSNMYMLEVVGIWTVIIHLLKSNRASSATYKMTGKMKKKCEKYWSEPNKLNMLLLTCEVCLVHDHNLISLRLRYCDSPMILNHKK